MRKLVKACILSLMVIGIFPGTPQRASAQEASVSFQVFYDGLSPYGYWVDYPDYGYVWVPNVGVGFAPYSTAGHWVYTDDGWMWVSDYPWGWAPFHYGRWFFDDDDGWLWIPGEEWGPAWVSWRVSGGFYGWAPIGPGFGVGRVPPERWCFVQQRYFTSPYVSRYYAPRSQNMNYISNSRTIDRTFVDKNTHASYAAGPGREDVERSTGSRITPVSVQSSARPGQNISGNRVSIYRPTVSRSTGVSPHPAPARVTSMSSISHRNSVSGRSGGTPNRAANYSGNGKQAAQMQSHRMNQPAQSNRAPQQQRSWAHSQQQQQPTQRQQAPQNHPQQQPVQRQQAQPSRYERPQQQPMQRQQAPQNRPQQQPMQRQQQPNQMQRNMPPPQRQVQPQHSGGGHTEPKR